MRKLQIVIILFSLLFSSFSQGQTISKQGYKIDSTIKDQIDELTNSLNGVAMGKMEIRMYENDSLIFDNYGKDKKVEFLTMTTLDNDTFHSVGFAGMFAGFGFFLDIYKNNYVVTYLVKSDVEVYKYNQADTTLAFGLSVACPKTSLTLANTLTFKQDEVISGIVELNSSDFWEVSNGEEKKYRMELKAYFNTGKIQEKK